MVTETEEKVSIREAAKAVRKGRAYVRQLIESGKLTAWRRGGTPENPRLVVYVSELRRVMDNEMVYVPKGKSRQVILKKRRRPSLPSAIDPAVANW